MEASSQYVKHQWVALFATLIFFFNSFLLPEGLTIVLLFTPVWAYFLYLQKRWAIVICLLIPLIFYAIVHITEGVSLRYYLVSVTMLSCLIIFTVCCYYFVNSIKVDWDLIFRNIAILNFLFVLLSLPLLFIPLLKPFVWYLKPISDNIAEIPRLKLFVEEASHYSYWLAPIAIYFYCKVLFFKPPKSFFTLFIVTLPLLFSFALGALTVLLISSLLTIAIYSQRIFRLKQGKYFFIATIFALPVILIVCYNYFPNNILFHRIHNIFNGDDTSVRGRTYEAFILANKIVSQKSYWWGIGPGQLKLSGRNIVLQYYQYVNVPQTVRIPNACAETIVYFGYAGFAIRLLVQLFLFFRTKVFSNPYRFWLFLFVFIYQFAGSYITNVAEYIIYIFVFSPVFPEFKKATNQLINLKP